MLKPSASGKSVNFLEAKSCGQKQRVWMEEEATLWIEEVASLCKPEQVHLCSGSREEYAQLQEAAIVLNCDYRPDSLLTGSYPPSARADRTFICTRSQNNNEPTDRWNDTDRMLARLHGLFDGSMIGRIMYVVPFATGPLDSPKSRLGFEITDSPDVVANMHIMTLVGEDVLMLLEKKGEFVRGLHTLGCPIVGEQAMDTLSCYFPEAHELWSYRCAPSTRELLHEFVVPTHR
ncbi:MAG: hypothetical protein CXZ00_11035 [Acidobacteria bacterium]|nr:MAG: hypothetical protein CXZ00_11035 [Acidobacteriota bacterium]